MERLVFVTQLIDPEDPVLGFVIPQVRALTRRFELVVIANEVRSVPADLGARVVSLGKERDAGKVERGARYVAEIAKLSRRARPAAILAHMCPMYLTLATPSSFMARIPTLLWFVHPSNTPTLRLAEHLSSAVITASDRSYPRRGHKVIPIGHAIDTDAIRRTPIRRTAADPLRLLGLGRTSPIKGYDKLIRAVANARGQGVNVELRIVGPSITIPEQRHRVELQALANALAPDAITIDAGVPRADVPGLLEESDMLVNMTDAGSADKVVFEAMAAGRLVLVKSPAFELLTANEELPLLARSDEPDGLAMQISRIAAASETTLNDIGDLLRGRVVREHSLTHWVTSVERVVENLGRRRGSRLKAPA